MNKLNNKRIIVVTVCVIAFLALFFRSDNSIAPIIAEQSSTITSAEVDILSSSQQLTLQKIFRLSYPIFRAIRAILIVR